MAVTLNASTTAGFVQTADTSGVLQFQTNGTATATIDTSGNVGIGTSSPSARLHVNAASGNSGVIAVTASAGNGGFLQLAGNGSTIGAASFDLIHGGDSVAYVYNRSNASMVFGTNNTERARIDSSGNLLVGTTSSPSTTRLRVATSQGTWDYGAGTGANVFWVINTGGTGVYLSSGNTSWSANSDERLKTDLKPIDNAVAKVSTLRSVTGRYKTDEENVSRSFLIAQDVQAVLPEAVNVQNDEQGTLGLQYTDVIPLLVAAIKEQQALITQLTERISALENK